MYVKRLKKKKQTESENSFF